jgi:N-acyl-D-aspartate/D-glutamate deacylase
VPGRYSATEEVIELAKIAAKYDSIYESHIRDESTFNIGFLNAVKEVIEIARKAKLPAHIAHIKALGVDVWGQSEAAITLINEARADGLKITADQYPWQASGTFLHSAVMPAWVMADSHEIYLARLVNSKLLPKIKTEITENIRRRGGAKALLITASQNKNWLGKTLQEIAIANGTTAAETVIVINLLEKVRVASFNMSSEDIESFMVQDWVVSSSDGTNGHPRKFASFPQKYQEYVVKKRVLTVQEFIHKSTAKTADIFSIKDRGYLKQGYKADINLIDLKDFQPKASFSNWNLLSTGVRYQFINGVLVIDNNIYSEQLPGEVL